MFPRTDRSLCLDLKPIPGRPTARLVVFVSHFIDRDCDLLSKFVRLCILFQEQKILQIVLHSGCGMPIDGIIFSWQISHIYNRSTDGRLRRSYFRGSTYISTVCFSPMKTVENNCFIF